MRLWLAPASALLALAFPVAGSQAFAKEPERAAPAAPLHTYLTADDYPAQAIRQGDQGTVGFRLTVGSDGRPTDCAVVTSSGSAALDAATCRIMLERTRFTPAKDTAGRPMADTFDSRINWVLPNDKGAILPSPAADAAMGLWVACTTGEAAKLVLTDLPAPQAVERVFTACRPLEQRMAAELRKGPPDGGRPADPVEALRKDAAEQLPRFIEAYRARLKGEPLPLSPQ